MSIATGARALSVLVGALCLCATAPAHGQSTGQVSGSVHDQSSGALAGVRVAIHGAVDRDGLTDDAGRFVFEGLPPGRYELRADQSGFQSLRQDIQVTAGQAVSVSLTLIVAILEQAVVTASKLGERDIQTLPLAVSAVPADDLKRLATPTFDQAVASMPSVTFTQNGSFGQLSIRGIGTNAVNAGADPSAAMYLDGVYLARPAMVFVDFLDLERVEILRGPQGTLYGRNAVGGALNLISKTPTNDFEAEARLTAGTLDERRGELRVSGPLSPDRVMGSIALARGVRNGYVRDLDHPDHRLGADDSAAARGHLRVVLGQRTELLVSGDLTDQDGTLLTFNKVLQVKPGFAVNNPPDLHDVRTSIPTSSHLRQSGAAVRVRSALTPSTTLVSLTAFRKLDNEFLVDADVTELHLASTYINERQHQLSQEITLSQRRPRLSWVAGLFLFDEHDHQEVWLGQLPTNTQVNLDPRVDVASGALFGEATIGLTSTLSAIAGLRYTHERKDMDNAGGRYTLETPVTLVPPSGYAYTDSITHRAWTPKIGLEVKLPGQAMAYVSATRGFKSGGFNLSSTAPGRGFAPEWAWNYEGGLKAVLLEGRARVNAAAFHMDYSNLQVQTPIVPGVFDIGNAARATIRGVELEAGARLAQGLEAGGHLVWLDAIYDRYTAVGLGGVTGDVAGNRLNNAPQLSGRLWTEWTGTIGARARLTLAVDATAQSTVYYTPFNDTIQRQLPYGLLGARVEIGPATGRWSINVYGRNLTDTRYITATFATSAAAYGGRPALARQVGVQFTVQH